MKIEYIIIVIVVLIIIMAFIAQYNNLVQSKKKIERGKALVDVYLKKRFDLIPNLVEVCKGYAHFEQETLERIIKLRSTYQIKPNEETENKLSAEEKKLVMLMESYPELKASDNYLKLQKELTNVENELQASRRIYVNSITHYNTLVMRFPTSLVASLFGFKEEALPHFDYQDVLVKF